MGSFCISPFFFFLVKEELMAGNLKIGTETEVPSQSSYKHKNDKCGLNWSTVSYLPCAKGKTTTKLNVLINSRDKDMIS
jgi:hypothetical protein